MHKVSTPGDRRDLAREIPVATTKLEMAMPIAWNTSVMHIFVFHTLDIMKRAGPFHVANILSIERYHTLFKTFARSKKHVMASINNHFQLHDAAQHSRMNENMTWTHAPARSTFAGHAARLKSDDKSDRLCDPVGRGTAGDLTAEELQQVQTLWADHYPVYHKLHQKFNRFCRNVRGPLRPDGLSEWRPIRPPLSNEEQAWQKMKSTVKVCIFEDSVRCMYARVCVGCGMAYCFGTAYCFGETYCFGGAYRFVCGRISREFDMEAMSSEHAPPDKRGRPTTHTCVSTMHLLKPDTTVSRKRDSRKSNACLCTRRTRAAPREWWSRETG